MSETINIENETLNIIEPEIRRGRGRPRKEQTEAKPQEKTNTENTVKPKRRKKGSITQEEIIDRAKAISAIHGTIAFITKTPEFMLQEQEALALAQANLNLENEFNIELDGKTMAIMTMLGTMFMVYRPRIPIII